MRKRIETKSKEVKVSLTPKQYLKLKAMAGINNESMSNFIRRNIII